MNTPVARALVHLQDALEQHGPRGCSAGMEVRLSAEAFAHFVDEISPAERGARSYSVLLPAGAITVRLLAVRQEGE